MLINISQNYSPNFNKFRRNRKNIKFLVIHYTGMKSEKKALNRLTDIQSEVSSHYFVKKKWKSITIDTRFIYCMAFWKINVGQKKIFKQKLDWD